MGILIIVTLAAAFVTYAIGTLVTLRLAIVLCLAVLLFGVSMLVMPNGSMPTRDAADNLRLTELDFAILAVSSFFGSTLGLIAAWIVKRMRETAV
jgi:hypothetical protein